MYCTFLSLFQARLYRSLDIGRIWESEPTGQKKNNNRALTKPCLGKQEAKILISRCQRRLKGERGTKKSVFANQKASTKKTSSKSHIAAEDGRGRIILVSVAFVLSSSPEAEGEREGGREGGRRVAFSSSTSGILLRSLPTTKRDEKKHKFPLFPLPPRQQPFFGLSGYFRPRPPLPTHPKALLPPCMLPPPPPFPTLDSSSSSSGIFCEEEKHINRSSIKVQVEKGNTRDRKGSASVYRNMQRLSCFHFLAAALLSSAFFGTTGE